MASANSNVYQFKITLKGSRPSLIWRRIQVPEAYSFWALHVAITDVIGWADYHNHQFEIANPETAGTVSIGYPHDDDDVLGKVIDGRLAKIAKYFVTPKQKAMYTYNFGDEWEHEIVFEKILPATPGVQYPQCIAGSRAGPPEDCGGIQRYKWFCKVIANPDHEKYKESMEWLERMKGKNFDPAHFDSQSVKFSDPEQRAKICASRFSE